MKNLIAALMLLPGLALANAEYQLSTHILDISAGKPAPGVTIELFKRQPRGDWAHIDSQVTDGNGRIRNFLPLASEANDGVYKLDFQTAPYFAGQNLSSFYPNIEVVFEVKGREHYHVPITLSPYGYSTYRGN